MSKKSNIDPEDLEILLTEIATEAMLIDEHCFVTDTACNEELYTAFFAMRARAARMGWLADLIATRAGLESSKGGAEEWLLPPVARSQGQERARLDKRTREAS